MNINNAVETLKNLDVVKENNIKVTFHPKGETSNGDESLHCFIRETNKKYFNDNSSELLLDDFVELSMVVGMVSRVKGSELIEMVEEGTDMLESYIKDMLQFSSHVSNPAMEIINNMNDYELIKDKLIIRPIHYTNINKSLDDYVYSVIGDIALVLYAIVSNDNGCLNTVKIPLVAAESWGIPLKDMMTNAMLNTQKISPARIYTNMLTVNNTPDDEADLINYKGSLPSESIPLVTTKTKTNGAIALFYPGVKERISEMFGDSFYVAFTSIHEAMIHKKGTFEPKVIKNNILSVNSTFGIDETLTYNVFYYDMNDKSFIVVDC